MKKYKRYSEKKIIGILNRWKASGLSKQEFCRNEKIANSTFGNWYRKYKGQIKSDQENPSMPAFIPIELENQASPGKAGISPIELLFPNGVQLRCTSDIDIDSLKRLIW